MSLPMYPYTNMSDTNLDWLIADNKRVHVEMKETTEYIDKSKTYIDGKLEDATTQAENAQSSAENAQSSAKNAQSSAENATASAESASDDAEYIRSTRNQVDLLQSRVDNIIPSGTQTEGNTELIDIRVGANGVTYSSAGNAVRGQVSDLQNGIFNNDLIDQFELQSDGFAPEPVPCVVSYFNKVASTEDAPFYPLPMGEWYPVQNLDGSYRYAILKIPTDLVDSAISISFWVKYADISATTSIRFSLTNEGESIRIADFTRYVSTALHVGAEQTKNDCTAKVDAEINGWYHINITVPANKGVYKLIVGSDYFTNTHRIYWSMPVVTEGEQYWFIKYKNKYYPAKENDQSDILYGKKIGWFGDSIMLGRHTDEDYGWYNNLISLGCAVTVKAINGAMVSVKGPGYHSIISETGASVFDSDTDYLIFDGGANDFFNKQTLGTISENYSGSGFDTSTYIGALEQICYNLISNYPSAKIGYIIPYKMETYADIQAQKQYFDNAIKVCEKWGIPVLDMRYMCALNYNISSMQHYFKDDVHINRSGYEYTESIVAEWMRSL